jgi:hypothetical protein
MPEKLFAQSKPHVYFWRTPEMDRMPKIFLAAIVATVSHAFWSLSTIPSFAQTRPQQAATRPVPRQLDGRVNFGPPPGEKGHWIRMGRGQLASNPNSTIAAGPAGLPLNLKLADVPFQPWARALYEYRQANAEADAPHARCKPSAGPRQIGTAYGFEIVDMPQLQRVFIFDIGGPHSYRVIFTDGRSHPKGDELVPSYYGHSVGRWEGNTFTVDTVGFNEGSWLDAEGLPHTAQLRQIERFTRIDFNTLRYEVTVDDPGAYTQPWTGGFFLRWNDGAEMFEYICQENNLNPELAVTAEGSAIRRSSRITP